MSFSQCQGSLHEQCETVLGSLLHLLCTCVSRRSQLQSLHSALEALSGGEWNRVSRDSPVHTSMLEMLEAKGVYKLPPTRARDLTTQRLDVTMDMAVDLT